MSAQSDSMLPDVMAHHEAGHAVAATVLGISVHSRQDRAGRRRADRRKPKTNPWIAARPRFKPPGEFSDEEWAELSQSVERGRPWRQKDNDSYAIYY
jgi:hypothetical protein